MYDSGKQYIMTHHISLAEDDALEELILVPLYGPRRPDYGAASGTTAAFLMAEEEKRRPPLRVPIWSSYK